MGKLSKRRSQQRNDAIIDEDVLFERMEEEGGVRNKISFFQLFFIQFYSILLFSIPWLSDCGNKGIELKCNRRSFEEKIESELSSYFFRMIYRMTNASFHKLHTQCSS